MVLVGVAAADPSIYYKETLEKAKSARFCLRPVNPGGQKTEKRPDAVNIQVVKGKTTTFIHLEEDEAKKVQNHGDMVMKKIQRIHKSVIWNAFVGRSFVDKIQKGKEKSEEINLDHDENLEFDPNNPRTWSEESLDFIKSVLKANEFTYDGFVVLFCVANNERDANEVDYDEMAWEMEKCLTYHFVANRSQIIMNEEAVMSRGGQDPVSRKTKNPGGRKKAGFCVYLAYQLLDYVTIDQMVGESINKHVDVAAKKKQLLAALTGSKLMPQVDEKLRKQIKEIREFMTKDQLQVVHKIKAIKDPASMDMLAQFLTLVESKETTGVSGLMGLPQFLTFLNKSQEDRPKKSSGAGAIPRPSVAGSIRKTSIASLSSRASVASRTGTSSLASIPSSGSMSSNPETLRPPSKKPQKNNGIGKSGLPQRTASMRRPQTATTPSSLRNGRPPSVSASASASPRRGSNNYTPPPEGRITREDLRRMNKSYPAPASASTTPTPTKRPESALKAKKRVPQPTSYSRASIPMS